MNLPNGFTAAQIASCISPKRLELTILPTEKCNFRCTYCYEDFLIGKMPEHIQLGIERLLEARAPGLQQLALNWFGGEPLLGISVIKRIARKAQELSSKHGFEVAGSMTTNAYTLDAETLTELVALRHDFFQISLDGWREVHDQTRRRADGKGTFERIWKNLLDARETTAQFEFLLRIHVTHSNHESLETLCFEIGREFGGDNRFRLNFQDVRDMGGDNGARVIGVSATEFKAVAAKLHDAYKAGCIVRAEAMGSASSAMTAAIEQILSTSMVTDNAAGESASGRRAYQIEEGEPYICYAAKPNFFLIRADGRIGKCTVALNDPRNQLGHITSDGQLVLSDERMRPWFAGFENLDVDYLGCPIQYMAKPSPPAAKSPSQIPVALVTGA